MRLLTFLPFLPLLCACGGGDSAAPAARPAPVPIPSTLSFTSDADRDGWATNLIMAAYPISPFINVGDDGGNQELRGFVSFLLDGIPPNAVVTDAVLTLTRLLAPVGVPPEIRIDHVDIGVDLDAPDFGAPALAADVGALTNTTGDEFSASVQAQVQDDVANSRMYSEFRLRSPSGTDGDSIADNERFVPSESGSAGHPLLVVTYYVP